MPQNARLKSESMSPRLKKDARIMPKMAGVKAVIMSIANCFRKRCIDHATNKRKEYMRVVSTNQLGKSDVEIFNGQDAKIDAGRVHM